MVVHKIKSFLSYDPVRSIVTIMRGSGCSCLGIRRAVLECWRLWKKVSI